MPIPLNLPPTFARVLDTRAEQTLGQSETKSGTPKSLIGMWVSSGSPVNAEICAGSGVEWLLIDGEHSPLSLESIQLQLQAVAAYPVTPVVRVPENSQVLIKQYLDLGAQNLLVPMVNTPEDAEAAVCAVRYPPQGVRGVGSALSRGGRWGRIAQYLKDANEEYVSLTVQIESVEAVENAEQIAATDGVDTVFIGPSDLAATMGFIGQQDHPQVVEAIHSAIAAVRRAGKPVGINAFDPNLAQSYIDGGIDFILVGADVSLLARGSENLAARYLG
ncbi:MAG: HpcH/HpaI aldolase/citrate lyase family protein [Actinomycetaceae bacterium]|nr:HpcH/HpaI aldolase/citrate lyase family protein [Arcanobacterium sp.]MDD7504789.1 HpcH/HpaI aldolase/citrate lyase family protein [Actinomycetaceae bacterium]MDY6142682.1 HpcH/HpaI aldolase/citrate lyase family protein [Arcanobacterium sp.]